jgi:hypothetical protein
MTSIDDSTLVVVTGKGGTGRTTVAAAIALGAAARGRRTIVCEVGGQTRVPRMLTPRVAAPGAGVERPVADGLWATTIDAEGALEEWLTRQLPRRLVAPLLHSGAFHGFLGAAPGAHELLTITKAWELGQPRRWRRDAHGYDTVVLDAPASGHGLGMLRTPRTFAEIARVGPIAGQARAVADALADPARSRLIAVAQPGELAVSETLQLEGQLAAALGRPLDAIVVNGHGMRRAANAAAGRVRAQQAQLARLRREAAAPIRTLPFVFADRLATEQIRAFSTRLEEGQ